MTVRVVGPRDKYDKTKSINTTSRSKNWSRGLSPFFVGPIPLYEGAVVPEATNLENLWQFAKLYSEHATEDGKPTAEYFEWAKKGWLSKRAHRYPMGKGRKPLCHWWAGKALKYIEARKKIYLPLYAHAVAKTNAFARLKKEYVERGELLLWDFDGYDHRALGMTTRDVVHNPDRNMGHAFILAHLLEKMYPELVKEPPTLSFEDLQKIF